MAFYVEVKSDVDLMNHLRLPSSRDAVRRPKSLCRCFEKKYFHFIPASTKSEQGRAEGSIPVVVTLTLNPQS